ncbi:MAG TPA: DoxX family protein [Cyclobacteriaceae bacterium]
MLRFIERITDPYVSCRRFHFIILVFRFAVSAQLFIVHGLKKIGVGVEHTELIPNPFHLPETVNSFFAITANVVCPLFIILGCFTRLAIVPVLCVTLTGYFVVHACDPLSVRDIPFMYSASFVLLIVLGPGNYSVDRFIRSKL